ncbi:exodeoxyribonuclease III [Corynebacterium mendelii]|uniref:Exodeoxyribonuclease III n=1 Tax=Corynebacterium mendelii TaxID=2765362 RepID=A0A939E3L1_9CORY|nr:exodeoxyribonuclease III [Corynebacterium mendelii]MBN9645138.1 exodeoxyribonuclease III [Corynebacterium mendelii]
MRIATWNVNSARARQELIVDFLTRHDIDVLAMQETKCTDENFPREVFTDCGYQTAHTGFSQWNGVAIASRVGLDDVATCLNNQPGFAKDQQAEQTLEARAIGAVCGGIRVWSLYVPNGRAIGDPHYDYKLRFLDALAGHARAELAAAPDTRSVYVGDFNVAPTDDDVWDREFFRGKTHVTEPERAFFAALEGRVGLVETTRRFTPGAYTYWDYQQGRFFAGEGMRIDFQWATPALARLATGCVIDTDERGRKATSDHAPVIVDYDVT